MRGEHYVFISIVAISLRFIPACAGNTISADKKFYFITVHPRMRGEHAFHSFLVIHFLRFIPACAGNTIAVQFIRHFNSGSSPHARGTLLINLIIDIGISVHPRMRGEHGICSLAKSATDRFIPACARNTLVHHLEPVSKAGSSPHARGTLLAIDLTFRINPVHPRMRGEHYKVNLFFCKDQRFIPACAGNTSLDKFGV